MRTVNILFCVLVTLSVASCGGGGGSGGTAPVPSAKPTTPPEAQGLGSRNVPGGSITVDRTSSLRSAGVASFRIHLDGNFPTLSAVEASIGAEYLAEGAASPATAVGQGLYAVELALPADTAGQRLWVRLRFADGSVIESGADDFVLAGAFVSQP